MFLPVVHKGVTLTEIPNRISVFFEFGNCQCGCIGCHSTELWDSEETYTMPNMKESDIIDYAEEQMEKGANAIVFLGGLQNSGVSIIALRRLVKTFYDKGYDVGLYDGTGSFLEDIYPIFNKGCDCMLKWIKTGRYLYGRGGLDDPNTNQKFYEKKNYLSIGDGELICVERFTFRDMTEKYFQKGKKNEHYN